MQFKAGRVRALAVTTAKRSSILPDVPTVAKAGMPGFETSTWGGLQAALPWAYTPKVLNNCMADTAFGLVIDVARRFSAADRFARRGDWRRDQYPR